MLCETNSSEDSANTEQMLNSGYLVIFSIFFLLRNAGGVLEESGMFADS